MDSVFNCASCHGRLIARTNLRGLVVQCAHCAGGIEIRGSTPVTAAVVKALLEAPIPALPAGQVILRRVRTATRHTSAGASHPKARLAPGARISRAA